MERRRADAQSGAADQFGETIWMARPAPDYARPKLRSIRATGYLRFTRNTPPTQSAMPTSDASARRSSKKTQPMTAVTGGIK